MAQMARENTKGGFTMIELLVVIAIIGILMGIGAPQMGRMMDNARAHRCRNNLRNLHSAAINFSLENSRGGHQSLPVAMSHEHYYSLQDIYRENPGWVRWYVDGEKPHETWPDEEPQFGKTSDTFGFGEEELWGIENGSLFAYMSQGFEQYLCPVIHRAYGNDPELHRTYAMNAFFNTPRNESGDGGRSGRAMTLIGSTERFLGYMPEASKLLLFAETEPRKIDPRKRRRYNDPDPPEMSGDAAYAASFENDSRDKMLTASTESNEAMLCMHRSTGNTMTGLAVFLDGHIETLTGLENGKITMPSGEEITRYSAGKADGQDKINLGWHLMRGLDPSADE